MMNTKYTVYYNDEVNEIADVFSADTLEVCTDWINKQLTCMTPVNEDYPCSEDVMCSSKTFFYEVYDRPIVETVDDEDIFNESIYSTDYYYAD